MLLRWAQQPRRIAAGGCRPALSASRNRRFWLFNVVVLHAPTVTTCEERVTAAARSVRCHRPAVAKHDVTTPLARLSELRRAKPSVSRPFNSAVAAGLVLRSCVAGLAPAAGIYGRIKRKNLPSRPRQVYVLRSRPPRTCFIVLLRAGVETDSRFDRANCHHRRSFVKPEITPASSSGTRPLRPAR